jgi:hypothetical protein
MRTIEDDEDNILSGLNSKNSHYNDDNGNGKSAKTKKNQAEGQKIDKKVFVTHKYSQLGRGELKEAVLNSDLLSFIKYHIETKEFGLEEKIEEKNRNR